MAAIGATFAAGGAGGAPWPRYAPPSTQQRAAPVAFSGVAAGDHFLVPGDRCRTDRARALAAVRRPGRHFRGYVACFNAEAAQALFGLDLAAIQDRFVPVDQVTGEEFAPLWAALLASDEADYLTVLEEHLAARWLALEGRIAAPSSLRRLGRHWVERLAWQAHKWRNSHSERHVERRIKSFSGRSMREWQSLVRTEGLFFAARDLHEAGQPFDWAAMAQDEGFSDQAHMSRMVKRITGFSPSEFSQRFVDDESFWMYRLWV